MYKKIFPCIFIILICLALMTGCSFFEKDNKNPSHESTDISKDHPNHTEDREDVPVSDTTEEQTTEEEGTTESSSQEEISSNPRENVSKDKESQFTAIGKYCGFIDSQSVEIELEDGSYCSFFVLKDSVRNTLASLDEEEMPDIEFTYRAMDGQINPEMIRIYPK